MKINSGTILIGFFAILCGLVGVHLYREATKPKPVVQQAPAQPKAPVKTLVPMVSRNLVQGQRITIDDVALVRMTAEQRQKSGLNKAYMTNPDQIIGKTIKNPLRRGDTFDTRDFYPEGTGPGISHRLKPGYRAMTIALTPTNALIGFAGAGQKVDVLFHYGFANQPQRARNISSATATRNRSNNRNRNIDFTKIHAATSTLAQDVEILALNHGTHESTNSSGVNSEVVMVTLAVRPRDAEMLRVARGHGELSLTLRSPTDKSVALMPMPSTVDDLINIEQPEVSEIEIFRGNSVSRLQFVNNQGVEIKPSQRQLPSLKIHIPNDLKNDFQFRSSDEPRTESPELQQPLSKNSKGEQDLLQEDPFNEYPALEEPGNFFPETGAGTANVQLNQNSFAQPVSTQQQNRVMLSQQQPQSPQTTLPSHITEQTNTPDQAPAIQRTATRPSLPGIRFADPYPDANNQSDSKMPNSIMSTPSRDYREVYRSTYGNAERN